MVDGFSSVVGSAAVAIDAHRFHVLVMFSRITEVMIVFVLPIGTDMSAIGARKRRRLRNKTKPHETCYGLPSLELIAIARRLWRWSGAPCLRVDVGLVVPTLRIPGRSARLTVLIEAISTRCIGIERRARKPLPTLATMLQACRDICAVVLKRQPQPLRGDLFNAGSATHCGSPTRSSCSQPRARLPASRAPLSRAIAASLPPRSGCASKASAR